MTDQKAVRPDWKVSTIPKDATNATDPIVASNEELEGIIANPASLIPPVPLENNDVIQNSTEIEVVPRFNANVAYAPQTINYSKNDEILMKAIRIAVKNGWSEYRHFANDAVTIGMEAEAVIIGMKKQRQPVDILLFQKDFCKYLWVNDWETKLPEMIMADDRMKYIEDSLNNEK